jgi:hypothetical protein
MIELRWLITNPVFGHRKLQYRQQVDTTIRAGMWPAPDMARTANMQWSAWHDVPEIVEQIASPIPPTTVPTQTNRCSKCNLDLSQGSISYVCPHMGCPTGLGSSVS